MTEVSSSLRNDPLVMEAFVRATAYPHPLETLQQQRFKWVLCQMLLAHPGMDLRDAEKILSQAFASATGVDATITLKHLREANVARQAEWCPDQDPDLSFRGNELAGEAGEAVEALILLAAELGKAAGSASNVVKKLERERHGWRGSRATSEALAEELADVVICADMCAATAGIDLGAAIVAKFNATSEKVGLTTRLEYSDGR